MEDKTKKNSRLIVILLIGIAMLTLIGIYSIVISSNASNDSHLTMRERVAAISQEPLPNHQEIEHSLLMTSTELADYLGILIEEHNSLGQSQIITLSCLL